MPLFVFEVMGYFCLISNGGFSGVCLFFDYYLIVLLLCYVFGIMVSDYEGGSKLLNKNYYYTKRYKDE